MNRIGIHSGIGKLALGLAIVAGISLAAGPVGAATTRAARPAVAHNTIYMTNLSSNSTLYTVNPTHGATHAVGSTGVQLTDLAFKGATLYAVSFSALYTVNPSSAHAQFDFNLGYSDINALVANPANGLLYASGNAGELISINPATRKVTLIGTFSDGLNSAGDLVYAHGKLYASLNVPGYADTYLYQINLSRRVLIPVGDIGFPDVWGLAVRSGTLYGATQEGKWLTISTTKGSGPRGHLAGANGIEQSGLATSS